MVVLPLLIAMSQTLFEGFDRARLAAIPARMREFVQAHQVAGAVVLVKRDGKTVLFDAEGNASLNPDKPMRKDTIFQVMSMTKPVTAIAVVMCAEQGLLNLDDPVEKFVPDFAHPKVKDGDRLRPMKGRLTIRNLLCHTGGIGSIDPAGLDDDAKRKITLAEYTRLLAKEPLIADPGERISYSGPGFALLGRIVEIVSGTSLQQFLHDRIFAPLGMKDTFLFAEPSQYTRIAYTYSLEDGQLKPVEENPFRIGAKLANPAGGIYSTAGDMATLLECVASGGESHGYRLLSPAGIAAMTTVQTGNLLMDNSDAQGFGLGFSIVRSGSGMMALKPIGTFGHVGAFGTEFWANRERGIVAVFMSQGLGNSDVVRKTFDTMVNAAFVGP
ncbi:MAG TPA: serine hydrolase domain-containing protein [Fimbriimonas sp.]|nr:serine hydrolase domain-containing protein [Fimbriimonas sp.]